MKVEAEVLKVTKTSEIPPSKYQEDQAPPRPSSFYIHDLWIEGARWDLKKNCLQKQSPKVLFDQMPVIKLTGVQLKDGGDKLSGLYNCPIYSSTERTDATFVENILLKCPVKPTKAVAKKSAVDISPSDPRFWQLQGTAIICNTN